MALKKRVLWIDPDGGSHTMLATDMEDAMKQISVLRKELGFPEPDPVKNKIFQSVVEIVPGAAAGMKGTIDISEMSEEFQKEFKEGISETFQKVVNKKLN